MRWSQSTLRTTQVFRHTVKHPSLAKRYMIIVYLLCVHLPSLEHGQHIYVLRQHVEIAIEGSLLGFLEEGLRGEVVILLGVQPQPDGSIVVLHLLYATRQTGLEDLLLEGVSHSFIEDLIEIDVAIGVSDQPEVGGTLGGIPNVIADFSPQRRTQVYEEPGQEARVHFVSLGLVCVFTPRVAEMVHILYVCLND